MTYELVLAAVVFVNLGLTAWLIKRNKNKINDLENEADGYFEELEDLKEIAYIRKGRAFVKLQK